ncbi:serine/threonine protein kinase [Emydomyces testavorans]|uniref:non-specific serine/threonine protein kinase n=1 Tax=Emydomyces testavorans TaxID=2070801 RepID=A0AAF0IKC4_9EURO|nr:serine/threonine protein kinase [Emydomyces testavorans]
MTQQPEDDGLGPNLPVRLGDVFCDQRYKVLRFLGSGLYSKVWLVRDNRCASYRALKILKPGCYGGEKNLFEREILSHLRDKDATHPGHAHIPHFFDTFEHNGPTGRHVCLVLELMVENLSTFPTIFDEDQIPNAILKRFVKQLLLALDYAHQSGVIHTGQDIQPNNIMIKIKDHSHVDEYLEATAADPSNPEPHIRNFFLTDYLQLDNLDVALCDWGSASWTEKHLTELIQPELLRAPEVLLKAPWGPKVDIWNLGAVLPELLEALRIFNGRANVTGGRYLVKHHLEETDALLGPFTTWLLENGDRKTVSQYFQNSDGQWELRDPIPRPKVHLGIWAESLNGTEKENFLALLGSMMQIDPNRRKSAAELLKEPWLLD